MSSVQHGVPSHSAQSTGEPAWLRRTLIAIALLFVATFLILPLAAVFTEALRKGFDAFSAALINGTAAHGEDYDDTFEGGPVHSGAVIVPAVMAICEQEGLSGEKMLLATAYGSELLCRLSLVTPKAIHKAGFHPTAVIGTMAAAAAVSVALGLNKKQTIDALGIAGSMASGIIEYLAEGTWTKRMHAGWAAQSGIRAALMARGGFLGPRTVFEGTHGFYYAFARNAGGDYSVLTEGFGKHWYTSAITFKPYATGTMNQPYVDCALRLAQAAPARSLARCAPA